MLRTAFIGCGGIANAHVPGWQAVQAAGQAAVVALCDVSDANIDKLAAGLGLEQFARYHDWTALLAQEDLDAVDICLPHHLHAPAILDAAAKGVHILSEKPLCTSFDEAASIKAAVEAAPVTLMCAHNQLFFPAIRHLRERIEAGAIGAVQQVYSGDCFRLDRTVEEWGWRAKLATAGGGVLIDTGYHPSYRLLHMAGSSPVQVTALSHNHHCPIEGEDTAHVLVKFANQALGQISTSWAFPMHPGAWQVAVFGSEGAIFGRGNDYLLKPYNGSEEAGSLPPANGFAEEVKHFVGCLLTGERPIQTHDDGINVLKLILGAYQAIEQGVTVRFEE
ncbi:MAG: Gfo/Idh/MocA family oxidoreductase [Fimbriimonadaceae bacterium]|nr:Gfo/Idh/MocA family oxidoreductase [Fimbriimonadaceae bacterium]